MRHCFFCILTLILLTGCEKEEGRDAPRSAIYPSALNFGAYKVGFTTLWSHDKSRAAVPYSDWHGKLYPTTETAGRQLQVNLFYPAAKGSGGQNVRLQHFIELSYRQVEFNVEEGVLVFGVNELKNKLVDLGGLDTLSQSDYEKLVSLQCVAVENARPIEQAVPLILFPNGTAPLSNSVTAEYLASHGFAVAVFSVMGAETSTIDASAEGIEVAVEDISFVLNMLTEIPYVDRNRVGLLGNAIESSFCAAYMARNKRIRAFVSLEGGFISHFEQSLLNELPSYKPSALTVPMLLIYSPHPNIDPEHIRHLKYSERYFVHLPGMREFDYLNFGLMDGIVPGIIGETRGDVRMGFSAAQDLIRLYFDAVLNDNIKSFEAIFQNPGSAEIDTTFIWPAIPNLPSMVHIKDGFIKKGIPFLDSLYVIQKKYEEAPFTDDFITDFKNWVSWKKDPEYKARIWLYQKAVEDYPASSLYNFNLGRYSLSAGDTVLAKIHYKAALEKLSDDPDELLTENDKAVIRTNSLQVLENLN